MDPNETLARLREIAQRIMSADGYKTLEDDAQTMSEHFVALDEWLVKGGFIPKDWRRGTAGRLPDDAGGL